MRRHQISADPTLVRCHQRSVFTTEAAQARLRRNPGAAVIGRLSLWRDFDRVHGICLATLDVIC